VLGQVGVEHFADVYMASSFSEHRHGFFAQCHRQVLPLILVRFALSAGTGACSSAATTFGNYNIWHNQEFS
jgi:hypothetical protein